MVDYPTKIDEVNEEASRWSKLSLKQVQELIISIQSKLGINNDSNINSLDYLIRQSGGGGSGYGFMDFMSLNVAALTLNSISGEDKNIVNIPLELPTGVEIISVIGTLSFRCVRNTEEQENWLVGNDQRITVVKLDAEEQPVGDELTVFQPYDGALLLPATSFNHDLQCGLRVYFK